MITMETGSTSNRYTLTLGSNRDFILLIISTVSLDFEWYMYCGFSSPSPCSALMLPLCLATVGGTVC